LYTIGERLNEKNAINDRENTIGIVGRLNFKKSLSGFRMIRKQRKTKKNQKSCTNSTKIEHTRITKNVAIILLLTSILRETPLLGRG